MRFRFCAGKKIFAAKEEAGLFKRALFEVKLLAAEQQVQADSETLVLQQELSKCRRENERIKTALQESENKRHGLQQWKTHKTQLLAGLEDTSTESY